MEGNAKDLWKRIAATVGVGVAIIAFALLAVALLAIFGVIALWGLAIYAVLMAIVYIRLFFRRRFGNARSARPPPPRPQNSQFKRHFDPTSVKTIDVAAEVEYVDEQPQQTDRPDTGEN